MDDNVIEIKNPTADQQRAADCFTLIQSAQITVGEIQRATATLNWLRAIVKGDVVLMHAGEAATVKGGDKQAAEGAG